MVPSPRQKWLLSCYLPYQLRWILDDSPISLALKGRQLGFSDATAAWIILRAFYEKAPVVFLSASERIAEEMVATVKAHCDVLRACGQVGADRFCTDNASELEWSSGGRLIALSSSERTSRSWHGHMIFDEFANHQHPDKVWAAAAPMATRANWKIRVISTPQGAQGLFYKWCQDPPDGWNIHRVSLEDAEGDGLKVDRAKLLSLVGGDERVFAEAYQLRFLDGSLQYLPTALVDSARDWKGSIPSLADADWYAGLDVGRNKDATALAIVGVGRDGIAWVVDVFTARRTDFDEQKAMIRTAREAFKWNTLHVDETGLGMNLAEDLVKEFGESEVIPVRFSNQSKEDLFTRAFRYHRNGAVRYPRGEMGTTLSREAISLRRVVSEAGNIVYEFPRTSDGHGDHFTALALALKGAGEPPPARGTGTRPLFAVA